MGGVRKWRLLTGTRNQGAGSREEGARQEREQPEKRGLRSAKGLRACVAGGSSHRCRSLAKRRSASPEKRGLCTTNCILGVICHVSFT